MTDHIEALYEHREALLIDLAASLKREDALKQQLEETQLRAESFEGSFNACEKQLAECKLCLAEIVRISDRKHDAWDRAKQLLAKELEEQ